jgi:hypothetical protein
VGPTCQPAGEREKGGGPAGLGKRGGLVWWAGWIVETGRADLDGLAAWVEVGQQERERGFGTLGFPFFSSFFSNPF